MRVALPGRPHLTYCTNIHPGESLAEVTDVVRTHVARVKAAVCPSDAFGVGLRLSARAAAELDQPGALETFRGVLADAGAYVFTINGFPYGAFHGARIKERVYEPDWREDARVEYSNRLAWLLARLLPDGVTGSVSTVPGAFGLRARTMEQRAEVAERLVRHAAELVRIREETGKLVRLALEPEPSCLLETASDARRFFEEYVFSKASIARLAELTGLSQSAVERALREHLGVCVDACHLAVEFEDAREALATLSAAGIVVGKIQVTCALEARFTGDAASDGAVHRELERFSDDVYLHQVVQRRGDTLTRYLDLPEAFAGTRSALGNGPSEWRIHFHVPVFRERLGPLFSTQPFLRDLFAELRRTAVTEHLEVETYTWDVLPAEHRLDAVEAAIARELEFTVGLASGAAPREKEP